MTSYYYPPLLQDRSQTILSQTNALSLSPGAFNRGTVDCYNIYVKAPFLFCCLKEDNSTVSYSLFAKARGGNFAHRAPLPSF